MSRLLIFDAEHKLQDEIIINIDRGWALAGRPDVVGGGDTRVTLAAKHIKPALQFGKTVMVTHPHLPNWAGMIDVPWNASLPAEMTIYNAEYILSTRNPDNPRTLTGTVDNIVAQILDLFNLQGDMNMRMGDISGAPQAAVINFNLDDGRSFWDQLWDLMRNNSCEMLIRSELDTQEKLTIYLDISRRLGVDTGFLYSDGFGGNAEFTSPLLDGPIINRVIGINDASSDVSRLRTQAFVNQESIDFYQMVWSRVIQFRNVKDQSTLDLYAQNFVNYAGFPRFSFMVEVQDQGDAWVNARLGNLVRVHSSKIHLPGGEIGYRGSARILAMAYTESQNILGLKVGLL